MTASAATQLQHKEKTKTRKAESKTSSRSHQQQQVVGTTVTIQAEISKKQQQQKTHRFMSKGKNTSSMLVSNAAAPNQAKISENIKNGPKNLKNVSPENLGKNKELPALGKSQRSL